MCLYILNWKDIQNSVVYKNIIAEQYVVYTIYEKIFIKNNMFLCMEMHSPEFVKIFSRPNRGDSL